MLIEGQWDLRCCMPCMHPGIVNQTDNGQSIEEQSDQEDEDSDDGDNSNEANSQVSAQYAAVSEVEDAIAKWRESVATFNLKGIDTSKLYALLDLCLAFKYFIHLIQKNKFLLNIVDKYCEYI